MGHNHKDPTTSNHGIHQKNVIYNVNLRTDPANPTKIVVVVSSQEIGEPITDFEIVHDKLMHLIIVSDDLSYFDHIHPHLDKTDGTFVITTIFPEGGKYKLWVDATPTGGSRCLAAFYINTHGTPFHRRMVLVADATSVIKNALEGEYKITLKRPEKILVGNDYDLLGISFIYLFIRNSEQFNVYKEQYGRFSIPVLNDWNRDSPSIRQNSVAESFEPKNGDDFLLTIVARDRHSLAGQDEFEQIIRDENTATVSELPGATLIQDTDCTKYVIDGSKACSVIFSVTRNQYTQREMDIDFQTVKQGVSISLAGSKFDKYLPIVNHMLNSMKVS